MTKDAAYELFVLVPNNLKEPKQLIGYCCSSCLSPYYVSGVKENLDICKAQAEDCCHRSCFVCNQPISKKGSHYYVGFRSACPSCWRKYTEEEDAKKEKQLFDKANKIPASEYQGEMFFDGEDFFPDYEDILDHNDPPPEYVWGCTTKEFRINAEDMVFSELEQGDYHVEAFSEIGSNKMKELQTLLDQWCKSTGIRTFFPDYSTAILIPPQPDEDDE